MIIYHSLERFAYQDSCGIYRWIENDRVVPDIVLIEESINVNIRNICTEVREYEIKEMLMKKGLL